MYDIKLYLKNIQRNKTPYNRQTHDKICKITRKVIGTYISESIPNVGDIIWYHDGCYYDVCKVIRKISYGVREPHDSQRLVILEVCPHSNKQYYQSGSDTWYEEVPLVTELTESE